MKSCTGPRRTWFPPVTHLLRTLLTPIALLLALASPMAAQAQDVPLPPAPTQTAPADGTTWQLGAGLLTALPAALGAGVVGGPGLSSGVAVDAVHDGTWVWGARASWSSATEFTELWEVTHQEIRVRAVGGVQTQLGRARVGLHLGLGPTVLYESRLRAQAARLGDTGLALNESAWAVLPGADLQLALGLPIFVPFDAVGPVGVTASVGPTAHVFQGHAVIGWVLQLGVAVWR